MYIYEIVKLKNDSYKIKSTPIQNVIIIYIISLAFLYLL